MRRTLILCLAAGAAAGTAFGTASAEGARVRFDCLEHRPCPAGMACIQGGEALALLLAPVALSADGSGRYDLTQDGQTVPTRAAGDAGPFDWDLNGVQHHLAYAGPGPDAASARMDLTRTQADGSARTTPFLCRTEP